MGMARIVATIVALLLALSCVSSAQPLRGSEEKVASVEVVADKTQAVALSEHVEPPNWKYANDAQDPLLAFAALLFVPLCGIPCMVKCKNGDCKKVWSAN